jgi:hypothetical protein
MKSGIPPHSVVHVPIRPGSAFWHELNGMHHWLHRRAGLDRFHQRRSRDDVAFYFDDADVAREFATRFAAREQAKVA